MIAIPTRALIIRQPWAGLFAAGLKVNATGEIVEFRNRPTRIRECVAVYAARADTVHHDVGDTNPIPECGTDGESLYLTRVHGPWTKVCKHPPDSAASSIHEEFAILCVANLSDCRCAKHGRDKDCPGYTVPNGMFSWLFTDLRTLPEPAPCKPPRGAQTWFNLDAETRNLIAEQLEVTT